MHHIAQNWVDTKHMCAQQRYPYPQSECDHLLREEVVWMSGGEGVGKWEIENILLQ